MFQTLHRRANELSFRSLFPAEPRQQKRLTERRTARPITVNVSGVDFEVYPGVYQTSVDTELMCSAVKPRATDSLLEIGCGCGAVSLFLSQKCRRATGVDINPLAVKNARANQERLRIANASFFRSDVFSEVVGLYDIILFNPPYNDHAASDSIDQMFWDPNDRAKSQFFEQVSRFLTEGGRVYLGWADFAELDCTLPLRLAKSAGLNYLQHFTQPAITGVHNFHVIEWRA